MPKSPNQKLKLLHLKRIFEYYTDEDHPIATKGIQAHLKQQDIAVERKTVYEDIRALEDFGMYIGHDDYGKNYRLLDREFTLNEVKLLMDSIWSSKFLTEKTTRELMKKLEGLRSHYEAVELKREVTVANRIKTQNTSIHYNLNDLHYAIAANKQIQFRYFDYDLHKRRKYFKKGAFYIASPWKLIYTDDNYYLLAYDEQAGKFKHFRVDKMEKIDSLEADRVGKDEFDALDMANYTTYTFNMFGGEPEKVTLVFQNRMVGAVMDRFGADVPIIPVDKTHFKTVVTVAVSQQFFAWVFGLGKAVKITAPESVKEMFHKSLEEIAQRHEEKPESSDPDHP